MSSAPTPLLVHRNGAWVQLTSADLLPGDLISLKRAGERTYLL
jgi:magnesium-transporting ATPase (P-type)